VLTLVGAILLAGPVHHESMAAVSTFALVPWWVDGTAVTAIPRTSRVTLSPMPPVAISERVAILALPLAAFGVVGWCWAGWQRMHAHTTGEAP